MATIKWSEYSFSVSTTECVSLHIIAQRVKQCCKAMNCKLELDFTERDKYFEQLELLIDLPNMATIKSA